ncbi:MAG TPA: hypothetical protein EYP85_10680 [Armatimonadetes bacterium]|nr:hypothetical protein [Armatimonadota bacterium]
MSGEKQRFVVSLYADLLQTIWNKTCLIVGPTTVQTLMESALFQTQPRHPPLQAVALTETGLDTSVLQAQAHVHSVEALKLAFEDFLSTLFSSFTILTGDLIVRQLNPHLAQFRAQLEELG